MTASDGKFELISPWAPSGDQPEAIRRLSAGIDENLRFQTLLGVTGSGKTFTIANVAAKAGRPVLVLAHNKTLAAQLYSEFKGFFPNISLATTTTTSPKPTCPPRIPT